MYVQVHLHYPAADEDLAQKTSEMVGAQQSLAQNEQSQRVLETMCEQLTQQLKTLQVAVPLVCVASICPLCVLLACAPCVCC